MRHCRWLAAAALLASLCAEAQAPADIRVALVIGNAAYAGAPLANPANDARAMGDMLRGLGFTVVELRDARRAQMLDAVAQVRETLNGKQAVGMLYYAGHGLQLDWRNYMVPVDARMASAADVPAQAVDVNAVMDAFKAAGNRMNIIVLDACRDNPFAGSASGKGLAQQDAPPGTFLAYATAPGNVAQDGDAATGNGLYTQYLLAELPKPAARIEDVFKRVRYQVRQQSRGQQIPWESTSLEDDFYFNTGKTAAVPRPDQRAREQAFDQEKADWDRIRESTSAADFYAFLQKYPTGGMSELAQARLERFEQARVVAQADRSGEVQAAIARRFRLGDAYAVEIRDGVNGTVRARSRVEVVRASDESADYTGVFGPGTRGSSTQAGAIIADGAGSYDPPYAIIPGGEYQVGKRWSGRSVRTFPGGRGWLEYSGRIISREKVVVPAGTFDTYRFEMEFTQENGVRRKSTFWAQPEWGIPLRLIIETTDARNMSSVFVRDVVSRQRGS